MASIISWFDYRNEEVDLLDEAVAPGFRTRPALRNLWRWYETYLSLFIVIAVAFFYIYAELQIIPLIQ